MSVIDFNVNLEDFDFSKPLPSDTYTLAFTRVEEKEYEKDGETRKRLEVRLTVVDDPTYAGRILFETFFPSVGTMKVFNKIQSVLGVRQEDGETVSQWLERVANQQPPVPFSVPVSEEDDKWRNDNKSEEDDKTYKRNVIKWFEAVPA